MPDAPDFLALTTHTFAGVAPVLHSVVVAVGMQGPPGPDTVGALRQENLLGEFAQNPQAQQQAQKNIGLGVEDPLAYYILAKS